MMHVQNTGVENDVKLWLSLHRNSLDQSVFLPALADCTPSQSTWHTKKTLQVQATGN